MKQAVIFGAGNIGRGFIGQLFSEAGYFVTFVDVDQPLLDALNATGRYTIRLVSNQRVEEVTVGPVAALHASQTAAVAEAVAQAELGATAVGAGALKFVAPNLAAGLVKRAEKQQRGGVEGQAPLNMIICENLKGAAAIFREQVREKLPESTRAMLGAQVGFVDTVIARMVPAPTPEMRAADPALIAVEPYKELPVDSAAFVGSIPALPGMIPFAPFSFYTDRKLYIHNAGHAVLAYLGYLRGYEYGYQALADEEIYFQARGAMEESALAMVRKYHPPAGALLCNIDDLLSRFGNRALGDTVLRLAREPIRKLARTDRLVGAALNALADGVLPTHLVTGIAAALVFDHPEDPVASDLQKRIRNYGLAHVLGEVSELRPGEPLFELVVERYRALAEARSFRHRIVAAPAG
jgi:mannitol-1-phosphate 5-dehydrogenase